MANINNKAIQIKPGKLSNLRRSLGATTNKINSLFNEENPSRKRIKIQMEEMDLAFQDLRNAYIDMLSVTK